MSAQVAQVKHLTHHVPVHAGQNGQLSQILFYNNRVPFSNPYGSQWDTLTGNPDNEYRKRRRHRYRLSKNTWAIQRPHKQARDRLRALITIT